MRQRHGWFGRTACLLVAAGLAAQPALAFYPFGFFSPGGQGGNLIFVTWPFDVLDADGDGDISGDGDGVPLNFEAGPDGFTEDQILRLFSGFEEWERVGTSFAAFSRGPDLTDPVELTSGINQIDGINAIVFQSPNDPAIGADGFFSLTLQTFVLEPTTVVIDNLPILFTEPQFIDIDLVFGTALVDGFDQLILGGLEGEATFNAGEFLGLGQSSLVNLVSDTPNAQGLLVEEEVVTLRNFQGILEPRGVTSSLFDAPLVIDLGNGVFEHAQRDLAPDDIAGITFLYPRQDSDIFFDITGYARTRSTAQIASQPIAGAWIRAYVNANNTSNRVPFVDTFTGLFTPPISPMDRHRFELKGLFKQMETPGGITFQANYTLTCAEFRPLLEFDAGTGLDLRTTLDSTHGGFGTDDTPPADGEYTGFGFDSLFLSEVFNETANIVGQQNLSQGTPLAFDIVRREVVSTLSGISLLQIVGPDRIIFGDDGAGASPTTGCPFNQIITAPATISGGGPTTPDAMRAFRDGVLLQSMLGVALTDLYYRVSPLAARSVRDHVFVERAFSTVWTAADWSLRNMVSILLGMACVLSFAAAHKARRRKYAIVAVTVALAAGFWSVPAEARTSYKDMTEYVADSHFIVHCTIESVVSHWTSDGKRIVTDVTVRVEDSVKGRLNKGGLVHIQLPTGQVGPVVTRSPQLPSFTKGEEAVLFLQDLGARGLGFVGGKRGKFIVKQTPSETKYVGVMAPPPNPHLRQAAAEIKALREGKSVNSDSAEPSDEKTADSDSDASSGPITLEEFKDYIRYLDRELRNGRR